MQQVHPGSGSYYISRSSRCRSGCWKDRHPYVLKLQFRKKTWVTEDIFLWQYLCALMSASIHTHTHKHRVLHTSICQPQLPIRGCMGLLILSAEEETCQSLLKMSFYGNHLNNHCVLMRKILQILLPHILHPRHGPGLLMLKCSPTEGTNDFPSCQAKW